MPDLPAEVSEALAPIMAQMAVKSPMTAHLIYLLHQLSPLNYDQRTVNDAAFHLATTWNRAQEAEAERDRLASGIEAMARDAERYRRLRERHDSPGDDFAVFKGVTIVENLDAAIDAMKEAGRGG